MNSDTRPRNLDLNLNYLKSSYVYDLLYFSSTYSLQYVLGKFERLSTMERVNSESSKRDDETFLH